MSTPVMSPADSAAKLTVRGKTLDLPLVTGSEGELAMDVEKLRAQTGLITMDPGYGNTGSCRSAITFIDGDKGILRYRGYPIEVLAEKSTFLEVAWLLIHGELPSRTQLDAFRDEAGRQAHLAGPIAQALMAKAPELLAAPPHIQPADVLGAKLAV